MIKANDVFFILFVGTVAGAICVTMVLKLTNNPKPEFNYTVIDSNGTEYNHLSYDFYGASAAHFDTVDGKQIKFYGSCTVIEE